MFQKKKYRVKLIVRYRSRTVSIALSRRLFSALVGGWAGGLGAERRTWSGIKRCGGEAGEGRGVCRELVGCCWCVGAGGRAAAVLCRAVCVHARSGYLIFLLFLLSGYIYLVSCHERPFV